MKLGPFEKFDPKNPEHLDSTKYKLYPGDVLCHTLLCIDKLPEKCSDELLLGGLFHDIGKPPRFRIAERIRFDGHDEKGARMTEEILKRMKFSNETVERVVALVANHMKWMAVKEMRLSRLKRFIRMPYFEEHIHLHIADCLASHGGLDNVVFIRAKMSEIPEEKLRPTPLITGHDLIEMGFEPGPQFKVMLGEIETKQLEGEITTHEQAIEKIKELFTVSREEKIEIEGDY